MNEPLRLPSGYFLICTGYTAIYTLKMIVFSLRRNGLKLGRTGYGLDRDVITIMIQDHASKRSKSLTKSA